LFLVFVAGAVFMDINGLRLSHYLRVETLMIDLALEEINREELEAILPDFVSSI
jgi:hypothetical protein